MGFFFQGQSQVVDRLGGLLAGGLALGDLHQGHQVRGVPPVHPTEPLWVLHLPGHVGHPQAGGVGSQQGGGGDVPADLLKEGVLGVQVLGDVFNDKVGLLEDGKVGGVGQPGGHLGGVLSQQPPGSQIGQVSGDAGLGFVQGGGAPVPQGHLVSPLGEDPGQGYPHGTGAGDHGVLDGSFFEHRTRPPVASGAIYAFSPGLEGASC